MLPIILFFFSFSILTLGTCYDSYSVVPRVLLSLKFCLRKQDWWFGEKAPWYCYQLCRSARYVSESRNFSEKTFSWTVASSKGGLWKLRDFRPV